MARGTGTVTVKFLGDVKDLKKATDDADGALGKVGSAVGGMAKTAAMVGIPALVGFGAAAVKAFAESEQVAAQTEAVIKSTGGAAKVTADHVDKLSGSLSAMSGVDDEVIAEGQNVLLTFTKVRNEVGKGNDVFDQATKAALNMSVALGTDMKSASMLMGKALNDPVKGMAALTRSGVSFTAQQKEQVKAMVAAGDTLGAQKLILKEMETQFGGSAKAAGETFAGQLNKLKVVAGNFMEDVGSKLVPVLLRVGEILGQVLPRAIGFVAPIFDTIKTGVMAFVAALREGDVTSDGFVGAMETIGDAIHRFIPVLRSIADKAREVFDAVSRWLDENRDKFRAIFAQIGDIVSSAWGAIKAVFVAAIDFLRGVWRVFGDDLIRFAREAWAAITETLRGALNVISGIFDLIKAVFTGKWGDAWTALKKIVDGAWDAIFGVIRNAVTNVIPTILAGLGQVVASVARTAFDGLKNAFKAALNWIIDRWNGLEFRIPGVGVGPLRTPEVVVGVPDVPRLARGGTFRGAALVGEAGPELLVGAGRVIPNGQLGGPTFIVNFYGPQDKASVAREIQSLLLEEKRRSGALGLA